MDEIKSKGKATFAMSPSAGEALEKAGYAATDPNSPLYYVLNQATGTATKKAPRLAFTENPHPADNYLGLYKTKQRLLPDSILKQIRIQDHLVASILRNRGGLFSQFGHLQKDRFDIGTVVKVKKEFYEVLTPEQYEKVTERVKKFERILINCGHTAGLEAQDRLTLAQFLDNQIQNGMTFGRFSCFPEKTTVYTPTGPKHIEDIKIGDKVYSHDGSIQKVKNTMNRQYEGTLFGIFTSGNDTTWATNEHPFYSAKDSDQYANGVRFAAKANKDVVIGWNKAEDLIQGDYIHFPNNLSSHSHSINAIELNASGWILENEEYRSVRFAKNKDFWNKLAPLMNYNAGVLNDAFNDNYRSITASVIKENIYKTAEQYGLSLPEYSRIPTILPLNAELGYFLGAFIGDGSVSSDKRNINIYLGNDKINLGIKERLIACYDSWGVKTGETKDDNCIVLRSYCPPLADWLSAKIGTQFDNKQIPEFVFGASESFKLNFIAGLVDTDGCVEGHTTVGVANEFLAKQLAILSASVGIHSKVARVTRKETNWNDIFRCSFDSKNAHNIPSIKRPQATSEVHHVEYKGHILKRISEIKQKQFSGTVFNIEVENTNSYVVNGLSVHNCEIIYDREGEPDENGNFPFHRFRPTDAGTIYRAVRKGEYVGRSLREQALKMLQQLSGDVTTIDVSKLREDEYTWIQVVDGLPKQAFSHNEMLVFNLYPTTDIEMNGYPVSPIDTVVTSITTHISIDAYKKLYFQNGRATKGMLVIKSDDMDESVLNGVKLQFNASINDVNNSFRTPVFGISKEDDVDWLPFSGEGMQDREFEFMYDQIARNILSAFGVSPDELPGYGHLSRGSNSQTLSEANNEFKLTAARDAGLRPLLLKMQTFFNEQLFPIIDPLLSKICEINFVGLDAQSKEQEAARIQQDLPTHMTYDEVMREVDKEPIGAMLGGTAPFAERVQLIQDKFKNVGELMTAFLGDNGACVDPMLKFKRDPFWLQFVGLIAQSNPAAVQAYFAPRPYALDFLKMNIQDSLDEDGNG